MPIVNTKQFAAEQAKKKKKTPEEIKNQEESNQFIQRREQLKSRAQAAGQTKKESKETAASIMRGELQQKELNPQITVAEAQIKKTKMESLAEAQKAEIQKIENLRNTQPPELTSSQRLTAAGISTVGSALQGSLGINLNKSPEELALQANKENPLIKIPVTAGLKAIGAIAGTRLWGVSISSLFDTSGNVKELTGDIAQNVKESKRVARAGVAGGDIATAIESQIKLEEGIRTKYDAAMISLRTSPGDVKDGLNLADDMAASLRFVTENRHALERFRLTGDKTEVLAMNQEELLQE